MSSHDEYANTSQQHKCAAHLGTYLHTADPPTNRPTHLKQKKRKSASGCACQDPIEYTRRFFTRKSDTQTHTHTHTHTHTYRGTRHHLPTRSCLDFDSPVIIHNGNDLDVVVGQDIKGVTKHTRVWVVLPRVHHIGPQREQIRVLFCRPLPNVVYGEARVLGSIQLLPIKQQAENSLGWKSR